MESSDIVYKNNQQLPYVRSRIIVIFGGLNKN